MVHQLNGVIAHVDRVNTVVPETVTLLAVEPENGVSFESQRTSSTHDQALTSADGSNLNVTTFYSKYVSTVEKMLNYRRKRDRERSRGPI